MKVLIEKLAKQFPLDFVMYVGEDSTNEPVFTYLNGKKQRPGKELSGVSANMKIESFRTQVSSRVQLEEKLLKPSTF